ncbi:MAG TPA: tetratricopeptide repeat protein [Bryobacteraceae bacterium]|nr:tetratricopeptide repeat protein [Bryobacteraceae bacterium]
MRVFAALTIFVSLTAGILLESLRAEQPLSLNSSARLAEAKSWLEQARREGAADPARAAQLAAAAANLANRYRSAGDYAEAEKLLRELLAAPPDNTHLEVLIRNNLADLLREEGRDTEAEPLFQETANAADMAPRERAAAFIGLADIDRQNGRWSRAIERWNAALDIARHEQDRRTEAIVLRGLGSTWLQSGSPARAEPLLRRSLKFLENDAEAPPELAAGMHSSLGELYRAENKLALAEDEWQRALEVDRTVFGDVHPQIAWLMEMLADVFSARGEFPLARDYAARAAATMSVSFGDESMPFAAALANRAVVEDRAGNATAAARDYEQAIRIGRGHPEYQMLQNALIRRYADLLKTMHRGREARALLAQADAKVPSFSLK